MSDIITKALLVRLSISIFNSKRQDKKITNDVINQHNVTKDAGRWIKNLIDPSKLEKIVTIAQQARIENYNLSLPWDNDGIRILPITMYNDYAEKLRKLCAKFTYECENFVTNYPAYVQEAKENLNGMFNPNEYPTQEAIKAKFGFNLDFSPLPDADDFRINLKSDEMQTIKTSLENRVSLALEAANRDLWSRLIDPIKHLSEKLKDEKSIFRNSIIENIKEIVSLVPSLNISDDANFKPMIEDIKKSILSIDAEMLRENKTVRTNTQIEAEKLIEKMKGYLK